MYSARYLINEEDYNKVVESYKNGEKIELKDYDYYKSSDRSHIDIIKFSINLQEYGVMGEYIVESNSITNKALSLIDNIKKGNSDKTQSECVMVLIIWARCLSECKKVWLAHNKKPQMVKELVMNK